MRQETKASFRREELQRCAVVGTSGAGKSVFAKRLSGLLEVPHVELDALFWGPEWTPSTAEVFRGKVEQAMSRPSWVIDGNYGKSRDEIWRGARTLVWLDYPLHVVLRRALARAVRRAATRETLWSGNRESWRRTFGSRQSVLLWVLQSHGRKRREYDGLLTRPEYAHLNVLRFRSPRQAETFLEAVAAEAEEAG